MGSQICIQNGETCVDCSEYAAAFSCLPKIKISGMAQLSELETISILDSKCEDILIPISAISCEKSPESYSLSLKNLLNIIGHTSVGERKFFPDKVFTAEGQVEEYELTLFNPSETRDMQVSYFAQWSSNIASTKKGSLVGIDSSIYIDDQNIVDASLDNEVTGESRQALQGGYDTFVQFNSDGYHNQDASSMPFFYTAVIPPKTETKIKMKIFCTEFAEGSYATAETIQLMITGTTR